MKSSWNIIGLMFTRSNFSISPGSARSLGAERAGHGVGIVLQPRYGPEDVLRLYRRRGKAEGHMGELKSVLDVHLGSTDHGCSTMQQVDARNEVQLLISLFAYELIHVLRDLLQQHIGQGWSLARLREQVLKVAALTRVHARRLHIYLGVAGRRWWPVLMAALGQLRPAQ